MSIKVEDVKKLRDMTGAGMMDAKKALEETSGDMEKAVDVLRTKGAAKAAKRSEREAKNGIISSYIHGDKIGVLVEVNCETDFVARTDDFKQFARDVAMHVAATDPEYLDPESVPADVVEREKAVYAGEMEGQNKPDEIRAKIIDGKLAKFYEGATLIKQPFIKDPDKTIEQLTTEVAAKVGENIVIRRYSRVDLGGAL